MDDGGVKYRCPTCNTIWRRHDPWPAMPDGAWQLWDAAQTPGPCCDNAPMHLVVCVDDGALQ